jgi:CRISPR-associated endonuclease/helicase Cas3
MMEDDEKRGSVFWAKTGAVPVAGGAAKTPWLPLLLHCLDVAAVARVLLDRFGKPPWAHELGLDTATLAAWVGLHDYGKATPGFQAKWPEGKMLVEQAGFSFRPPQVLAQDRHDLATAALLPRETHLAEALACILGGHHGYLIRSDEGNKRVPKREAPEWRVPRACGDEPR